METQRLSTLIVIAALLTGLVGSLAAQPALAASLCYVDADAAGANTGATWTDAYTSLQSALADTDCTEIWVAAGTYKPTTGTTRLYTFQLKSGVAIYGGFAATETLRSQRNWTTNVTILSGDLNGDDGPNFASNGENSYHVVKGANGATLDGVTISGGNADGGGPDDNQGGGLRNAYSSPTLANIIFSGNSATNDGGGLRDYGTSNSTLTNVTFIGNRATDVSGWGGGMASDGSPTLTDVTFSGNSAGDQGGGLICQGGSPTLTNVTFSGNSAGNSGGGMLANGCHATLSNVTFSSNSTAGVGGGLFLTWDTGTTLTNVTFSGNTATAVNGAAGGMYIGDSNSPTLTNVTFSSNLAKYGGGMVIETTASPTLAALTNVTFNNNSAGFLGGGILINDASPTLTNVTFSGNSAQYGGGIYYSYMTNPSPQVRNTILWGNTAASGGAQIYNESEAVVVTYSDVQGGYSGAGNINADPRFRNAASGDLTLLHTSPAIDAANNSALPADAYDLDGDGNTSEPLPYDLRGDPRQQDIPSVPNSGSGVAPIVDMGAYEASPILFAAPTAQGYDTCGSWANACALQSALSLAQSGDEVWAKAGTHIPTSGADRTATFQLKNGVAIYGGFAGTETARDQRNWMANIVTLSGDIGTVGDNSDNSYHVVTGVTGATLDGVTISGGKADLGVTCPGTSCGGGMFNNSSSPTLTNVIFTHNYGTNGGGMYNYASSPVLTNVIFSGNSAGSNGGGMYNYGGSAPTLTNVLFSGNSAGTTGGGMYNGNSSNPSLANVTFSGNSSTGLGPGIQNSSLASPILKNVILWDSKTPEINNGPGASATVTYSNIQGGYAGAGNINQDPQFVDADGPDNTFGTADDNPRPGFGSPVIDAGTDTGCPAADLDGLLRPNDGNGDSTATCDMGAYEAGEMVCSVSQGSTYSFANRSGVSIQVTTLGPNLACLYADEMELDHPNATGVSGGDGLKTGRYWLIRGLQSDKSTDASDFSVTLTLPTSFIPDSNDGVCRYTGSGLVWDCALTSFDNVAKTVTRTGVGGLSDWAAGKSAGPTAVELSGLKAYSSVSRLYIHVVFAGLALMAGIGFILICRKRPTSG